MLIHGEFVLFSAKTHVYPEGFPCRIFLILIFGLMFFIGIKRRVDDCNNDAKIDNFMLSA